MRRRSFMTSLGAGAGLGLLGQTGLFGGRASADCDATPKRLLVVVSSHGNYAPGYRLPLGSVRDPICTDGPDREVSLHGLDEDELSPILQPLHAYRDRMLALDGLTMTSAWVNRLPSPFNEHNRGQLHALTGANGTVRDGVVVSSGASLDQIVGSVNHRQSTRTSLNVGIRTIGTTPISYRLDRSPVGSAQSPRDVFDALFGSAPPPRTDVRATRVASGRARLFRALDREYSQARDAHALGRSDLDRLAAHRELIANVAASLDTDEVLCGAGVALPDAPPTGSSPPLPTEEAYDTRVRQWAGIIAAAFAADLTRTAVLELGELAAGHFGVESGPSVHQEMAHGVWGNNRSLPARDPRRRVARERMTLYNAAHARHVRLLCDALDRIPEDGGTMLDHTLVYWTNELADGGHGFRDTCTTLLGGQRATGFSMGRYVRFAQNGARPSALPNYVWLQDDEHQAPWWQCEDGLGPAHNRLLVSIAQAFDPSVRQVGEASIEGRSGEGTIDTTTPLSALTRSVG